eukprot:TRINITY_DN3683_c0_g1_i2.p1 TRINITY_DN3683_c0_g1~~TRINITY_DN3683_c0_g1_i2.p1  ORF type:complete len:351 (+),score=96.79 TRINITY_DN3683_c0_g1_i2:244-1296(+)
MESKSEMNITRRRRRQEAFEGFQEEEIQPPREKKVRFPKGKKQKSEGENIFEDDEYEAEGEEWPVKGTDPRLAAQQRATKRKYMPEELLNSKDTFILDDAGDGDIGAAEEAYENEELLEDDGIKLEPFNLNKEREEGYFDSAGNYVEYKNDNEIKDAWLESVQVDARFAEEHPMKVEQEEDESLTADEMGKIKRRIANVLEPGETVLKALRRIKGTPNSKGKHEKMPPETKAVFDQLTEDAMKLLEQGEMNVYDETKSTFEREADGYEALSQAKKEKGNGNVDTWNTNSNSGDEEDIFADDGGEPSFVNQTTDQDYVYDESSGYYYSRRHGYYYDPGSGLFCNAASGKWN